MDYYDENPSHQDQIDYIVFDCIVNEQVKIYSKEEWQSYLLSLLLSPPLDIKLNPDVLESLWEIDAQLVIESIERQNSEMCDQLHRLEMQPGKHSTKIAVQISEIMQRLEVQAMECFKILVEELHGTLFEENVFTETNFVDGEVHKEIPLMLSGEHDIIDSVNYDGLDAYMDASKSAPKGKPPILHIEFMLKEIKRGAYHLPVEEATILLKPFLLPSPCFKPWDPGGSSYMYIIMWPFFHKLWDPGGRSHVGNTLWSLYPKLWDPGGF